MDKKLKKCVICGKAFTPVRNQRCCSPECSREMRLKRRRTDWMWNHPETKKAGTVAKCPVCGTDFVRTGPRSVYCSKRCFLDARISRRRHADPKVVTADCPVVKKTFTKVCAICGTTFEAHDVREKYCSKICRDRNRRPPVPFIDKVCVFCGKPFKTHNSTARCCSKICADRKWRGWASLDDYEKAHAERKARSERDTFGLTLAQRQEVIDAQDGDPSLLWKRSQTWTMNQRNFAKKRYLEMHDVLSHA